MPRKKRSMAMTWNTRSRGTLARVLLPEIQAFFESEEGQREFTEWKAQQEQDKLKRN